MIDLLHLDKGTFIEDISNEVEFEHVIKHKNNDIRLLRLYTKARHFKASIFDMDPTELLK